VDDDPGILDVLDFSFAARASRSMPRPRGRRRSASLSAAPTTWPSST
jgi:hypothetical protein